MANMNISSYNTISSLGDEVENLDIAYEKLNIKSKIKSGDDDIIINTSSVLDRYYDIILKHTQTITLTDKEYITYRYRPKLYCYDMYGTVELWALLLKINNWTSVAEFNAKSFKVLKDSIFEVINEIMILESEKIAFNKDSIE